MHKAMLQLQSAPQLADLEEWTQWAIACEPALGHLSTCLSQHGTLCASLQWCLSSPAYAYM